MLVRDVANVMGITIVCSVENVDLIARAVNGVPTGIDIDYVIQSPHDYESLGAALCGVKHARRLSGVTALLCGDNVIQSSDWQALTCTFMEEQCHATVISVIEGAKADHLTRICSTSNGFKVIPPGDESTGDETVVPVMWVGPIIAPSERLNKALIDTRNKRLVIKSNDLPRILTELADLGEIALCTTNCVDIGIPDNLGRERE